MTPLEMAVAHRANQRRLRPSHVQDVPSFGTPAEAQGWAQREFNLPVEFLGSNWTDQQKIDSLRQIGEPLQRAAGGGATMPRTLLISPETGANREIARSFRRPTASFEGALAVTALRDRYPDTVPSVWVNANALKDEPQRADELVAHELGHVADNDMRRDDEGYILPHANRDDQLVARQVSRYATRNQNEFVAEAYRQQAEGEDLAASSKAYYDRLGGPPAPRFLPKRYVPTEEEISGPFPAARSRWNDFWKNVANGLK